MAQAPASTPSATPTIAPVLAPPTTAPSASVTPPASSSTSTYPSSSPSAPPTPLVGEPARFTALPPFNIRRSRCFCSTNSVATAGSAALLVLSAAICVLVIIEPQYSVQIYFLVGKWNKKKSSPGFQVFHSLRRGRSAAMKENNGLERLLQPNDRRRSINLKCLFKTCIQDRPVVAINVSQPVLPIHLLLECAIFLARDITQVDIELKEYLPFSSHDDNNVALIEINAISKNEHKTEVQYRVWDPPRSKLDSAILDGVSNIWILSIIILGARVLYVGNVCGLTVSDLYDL
ncbi:hypothetical protein OROHE_008412 [Orobanche hederae]